jgi:Fe-S cluster assembly scaffold protein SufB
MAVTAVRSTEWVSPTQVRELSASLGDPAPFAARRADAFERFLKLPLEPNPLYRGYGYFSNVDLSGIDSVRSAAAAAGPQPLAGAIQVVHDAAGTRSVVPAELERAGVRVVLLPEIWKGGAEATDAFVPTAEEPTDRLSALSAALLNRGYRLEVPSGFRDPIRIQDLTLLSRPHEALSVRRALRVGAEAQLLLTEETFSTAADPGAQRLASSTTDITLGERAKAVVLTVHAPDLRTVALHQRNATLDAGARLAWFWGGLGGFRSKVQNSTTLAGAGSVVDDLQIFYGSHEQSFDSSVHLTHSGTDTHGQSITRGVFTDRARGMSRGLVRIEHEARKTLSFISEHAMLLSKGARSDTIPILEILCRDVKATHSTSVHPVDPEQVFYLESRGFNEPESVRMIGEGFLSYVLDRAPVAGLRDRLYPSVEARWNGAELVWGTAGTHALPELSVSGTEAAPEWRFDAKLR